MGNSERSDSRSAWGAGFAMASAPRPLRRALLEERLHPLLLVGGGEAETEEVALVGDAVLDRQPLAGPQGLLGDLEGERALRRDLVGELERLRAQLLGGDDHLDEADLLRLGGGDHVAGEDQPHGVAGADQAGEALGAAAAGDQAEVDLRLAEARLV